MGNNTSRTNGSRHQKDNNDAIIISNNNNSTKTSQANGIHTTTGTGTATRSHNSTTKRDNNDDDSDNEDCQFPCFLFFTPRKIPFLQQNHPHSQNNKHDFGSPLPDTPVMERRRRQEITQQATTVFQREQQQQKYTNAQQQQQPQGNHHHHPYTGLETEEESSRSFRLSNFLIPPPASSSHHNRSNSAVAAINHVNGTHSLLLPQNRQQQQSTQQQQQPPMAPPYPEAEIYEGDDCEERLYEKYELCEVLGVGSTSTVHRCIHKVTGNEYACKIIDIQNMDVQYHSMMIQFHTEIASLKSIHHPGIIQLYDVYILSTMKIFIIMELMLGGELFDYVVEKGTLSEEEASQIVRTVLSAIHYLHTHSIIHRDLKPENLLLKYKPNNTTGNTTSQNNNNNNSNKSSQKHNHGPVPVDVKIIDFGLSKLLTTDDTVASTFLGTRGYLAPEMLQRREYTSAVDTWAMGVIVYVLLCGCLPFDDDATMILPNDDQVLQKRFVLRFPRWAKNLSQSAKDLLNHLLDINPLTRYTAEQALYHPWVRGETAPSKNLLASPGRIRKSPAINNKSQNQRNGNGGGGGNTKNYLGRKYAPDPCSLTPPTPRVRKGSF